MTDETTAPEGLRLYTITGITRHVLGGQWWLEAVTDDGTSISLANFAEEVYEVIVEGPLEPGGYRTYRGGLGSPAHDRFVRFMRFYEDASGGLLTPSWA